MSTAAKHLDPILGVDIHMTLVGGVAVPLPNPFIGVVMDPFDYLPIIGATVQINGLWRAQAGTAGMPIPSHIGPLVPPIGNEAEVFMGSATVCVDGDAQSHAGLMVLSCQSIGMPGPIRLKGSPPKSPVLPTSVVLSIPMGMPVMIGGPPTISLMALGFRLGFALLKRLGKWLRKLQRGDSAFGKAMAAISERANKAADALAKALGLGAKGRNRVSRAICTVTGHPVDVATGKVFTDKVDLELPGAVPFRWERVWYSTSTYQGPLGHGWHHSYDAGLYVNEEVVLYRAPDGRLITLPTLARGEEFFERTERLTLLRDVGTQGGYAIRTRDRLTYRFRDLNEHASKRALRGKTTPDDVRRHVLVGIHDAVGQGLTFQYDAQGKLSEIVDSGQRSLQLSYDRFGRIATLSAPHPVEPGQRFVAVEYSYDERGNLTGVRDALSQSATFKYNRHLLVQETDRNGLSFFFTYDASDESAKCIHTWGDGGIYDHKLRYEAHLTSVENSLGHVTVHRHRAGLVIETVDALGGVTLTEYNAYQQKRKETDPVGNTTLWSHDARGNTSEVIAADGAMIQLTYDAQDAPTEVSDAIGGKWRWSYDEYGRVTERVDPLGASTRFAYQAGRLSEVTDGLGHVTRLSYDPSGLLSGIHTPDGATSSWEYDRLGAAVRATDPNGNVQHRYFDLLRRATRIDEPDGNVRELSYDGEGSVLHAVDAQHDVRFSYQGMGRLASRSEAGTTVTFKYDTEEQLTGIVNEHGHVYRFELGPNGEVEVERGFDGVRRSYERDSAGRVTRVVRAGGIETAYVYDARNRVIAVEHARKTKQGQAGLSETIEALGTERYTYRPDGALIAAGNPSCAVAFERDALGRIVKSIQGGHWVESTFDPVGRRKRMRSSIGAELTIDRNAMGDVEQVTSSSGFQARMQRDLLGQELERELPGGLRSRWRRDKLGRPLRNEISVTGLVQRSRTYEWDKADRLRAVVDSIQGAVQYTHDALGNLASAMYGDGLVELRMPDAVGNLFKVRDRQDRKYGPAGQLLESKDARGRVTLYTYDTEGNLVEKREGQRAWLYRWAPDGMLREVQRPDGTLVRFEYDALGRRIAKHYRGQTTRWVWDGNMPLHEWVDGTLEARASAAQAAYRPSDVSQIRKREAELDALLAQGPPERGSAQEPITWLFEPESFAPMAKLQGGRQFPIFTDHLGAPILMTSESGERVWSAAYSAYGELNALQGARYACPFRWPGQYEDLETGLYYNRFRYYDPESGQYASQDPMRWLGGTRPYGYVRDPPCRSDPLGLIDPWDIQFSQDSIGDTFTDPNSAWNGRSLDEAVEEARRTGSLPEGLTLNVQEFGDGSVVTLNNRTLYVAQQANLPQVHPRFVGAEGDNQMRRLLDGHLPLPLGEQPRVRCS